jgi:activator of HSP90 ATPase
MPGPIKQSVTMPASAKQLYDTYLSSRAHAAITGAPVKIGRKPGSKFSAFDGALSGEILATVPNRLIVQRWRSAHFAPADPDSTLILSFTPLNARSTRIDLVHVDVSAADYEGVKAGWPKYYWKPWRKSLAKR